MRLRAPAVFLLLVLTAASPGRSAEKELRPRPPGGGNAPALDPNVPAVPIPPRCPQFPPLNLPGVLCEGFDIDRNGVSGYQWSRLPLGADPNDPLRAISDPNDDVLGYTMTGGPSPLGTAGLICADDNLGFVGCQAPVAEENDWHLHSPFEGPGDGYTLPGQTPAGAPDGGKARSGVRSMHMGRHLSPTSTFGDTLRLRQVSAFVLDSQGDPNIPGVVPGAASRLDFWHLISFPDDENFGFGFIPPGKSFGGGQVQISLLGVDGRFERWQHLTPNLNGYDSTIQETVSLCGFDPGDDLIAPANETMCDNSPLWADLGDVIGTDSTCTVDTDNNDALHKDCGDISGCSPGPGCTENGSVGAGVWARSTFNLSAYTGRVARLRWIGMVEGGWSFGTQRSVLESDAGIYQYFDQDDGWWIDDIMLTDLRVAPGPCTATDDDGDGQDECQGDCDDTNPSVYRGAPDLCDGLNNDCLDPQWPVPHPGELSDNDGDGFTECSGDCDDARAVVHPGAPEVCDGLNNDCQDPTWPEPHPDDVDLDLDGFPVCAECDDAQPGVYPGAPQICDGLNNDCDDPAWPDASSENLDDDGDGHHNCSDCAPTNPVVYPGAPELCDGIRNNCSNGSWNPDLEIDNDGDSLSECQGDCDDARPFVYPGAPEVCDGLNNDCNHPQWPVPTPAEGDADNDGYRGCAGDCDNTNPNVYPGAPPVCDGLNNDCNDPNWPAQPDENDVDADHDSFPVCAGDCDDTRFTVRPGYPQLCDGLNNDCNDPRWPQVPLNEQDLDGDGFISCNDCEPLDPTIYPGAPELCDGIWNNCFLPWIPAFETTDFDGDGLTPCQGDCHDRDASAWEEPSPVVLDMVFDGGTGVTTLDWSPPALPGGTSVIYDVLRTGSPFDLAAASCDESDEGDTLMVEPASAPVPFLTFYLVRAQNACPAAATGGLGYASDGAGRVGPRCP
ncbi:MAG: putative metal-binding motif-containing protein [Candidatus Polarisedimenticolia bacterium]